MIESIHPEQYPLLLDVQTDCIRGLGDYYTQQEIDAWIGYLEEATPERFAQFENRALFDSRGAIGGFVSWSGGEAEAVSALECLYVREDLRGRGIGRLLLREAEIRVAIGSRMSVRSTLNARPFYEKNDYIFKEQGISRAGFEMAVLEKVIVA
jgi:GNAT superfamily N-acetyltransferase